MNTPFAKKPRRKSKIRCSVIRKDYRNLNRNVLVTLVVYTPLVRMCVCVSDLTLIFCLFYAGEKRMRSKPVARIWLDTAPLYLLDANTLDLFSSLEVSHKVVPLCKSLLYIMKQVYLRRQVCVVLLRIRKLMSNICIISRVKSLFSKRTRLKSSSKVNLSLLGVFFFLFFFTTVIKVIAITKKQVNIVEVSCDDSSRNFDSALREKRRRKNLYFWIFLLRNYTFFKITV